ncbi:hypothetical protein Droror1_Dr00018237 [Drosera rotundifolia]
MNSSLGKERMRFPKMDEGEFGVESSSYNYVMSQLTDLEFTPLGTAMYLPQSARPKKLHQIVNKLLNNEEKLPYAFYISDQELLVQLESYLQKHQVSVEKVLQRAINLRKFSRYDSSIVVL